MNLRTQLMSFMRCTIRTSSFQLVSGILKLEKCEIFNKKKKRATLGVLRFYLAQNPFLFLHSKRNSWFCQIPFFKNRACYGRRFSYTRKRGGRMALRTVEAKKKTLHTGKRNIRRSGMAANSSPRQTRTDENGSNKSGRFFTPEDKMDEQESPFTGSPIENRAKVLQTTEFRQSPSHGRPLRYGSGE